MLCGVQRTGSTGCGRTGAWWEPRVDLDPTIADILADPAASYWLIAAASTAIGRDPVDALADAEALAAALRERCADAPRQVESLR